MKWAREAKKGETTREDPLLRGRQLKGVPSRRSVNGTNADFSVGRYRQDFGPKAAEVVTRTRLDSRLRE